MYPLLRLLPSACFEDLSSFRHEKLRGQGNWLLGYRRRQRMRRAPWPYPSSSGQRNSPISIVVSANSHTKDVGRGARWTAALWGKRVWIWQFKNNFFKDKTRVRLTDCHTDKCCYLRVFYSLVCVFLFVCMRLSNIWLKVRSQSFQIYSNFSSCFILMHLFYSYLVFQLLFLRSRARCRKASSVTP